jgi:hypothetical protein
VNVRDKTASAPKAKHQAGPEERMKAVVRQAARSHHADPMVGRRSCEPNDFPKDASAAGLLSGSLVTAHDFPEQFPSPRHRLSARVPGLKEACGAALVVGPNPSPASLSRE